MKCLFNFLVCKRRAIHTPLASREPAVLLRKIPMTNTSPRGALFPNSLAVTGFLAVLLGLRYVREKLSSKGRSVDQREDDGDAQEERDLESLELLDSDRTSLKPSGFLLQERGQLVLQIAKPVVRSVPDLSSIVHAQVFGESNLRSITKLGGVDIAPVKRSRKGRRKTVKRTPPHMSVKTAEEIQKPVPSESVGRSEQEGEKSCVVVHPGTSTSEPVANLEGTGRNNEIESQNSTNGQRKSSTVQKKKPRRRLNRDPRPRHMRGAQKPPQHAPGRREGNPGTREDAEKMAELPGVGIILDQREYQKPSGSPENSKGSQMKQRRPRRKPSHNNDDGERKTDIAHHDLGTARGRKVKGQMKGAPRRENGPKGSSSSTRHFSENNSQRHSHVQSGKNRHGSSSLQGYTKDFGWGSGGRAPNHGSTLGGENQLRSDPKVDSPSMKTFRRYSQSDQHRSDTKPYRPRNRGYRPRRERVDLDKP